MIKIKLSNCEEFALVSESSMPVLGKKAWRKNYNGYVVRSASVSELLGGKRREIYMHREIMCPPDGFEVDHIDRNTLNNCLENLRICTHQQNMQNRKVSAPGRSKYKGVSWHKGNKMWQANIGVGGRQLSLGYSKNEIDAAILYDNAAKEHYGEYAVLNFPDKN